MTVLCVLSLKGSPGVTTLSCLLAASWPTPGPVAVVEADPAGGDLAARFGLSSTTGWASLEASARRGGDATPLDPHLQHLPGGLPVLVGTGIRIPDAGSPEATIVRKAPGLKVVDLGRVSPTEDRVRSWLGSCDGALLVVSGEAAGALHARAAAEALLDWTEGRLGLVAVGAGSPSGDDVGSFVGIRSLGDVPRDPAAAAVASGMSGSGRRLERSRLLASVRRVADSLAGLVEPGDPAGWTDPVEKGVTTATPAQESQGRSGRDARETATDAAAISPVDARRGAVTVGPVATVGAAGPGMVAR